MLSIVLTVDTPRSPDKIVQHDFFSQGQYPAGGQYQKCCEKAGVGFASGGDKWPCQGRREPSNPLLKGAWDVVNPMPGIKLRPCTLVDAC
jgi:hypothetical protein